MAFLLLFYTADRAVVLSVGLLFFASAAMTAACNMIFSIYVLRFSGTGRLSGITGLLDFSAYIAAAGAIPPEKARFTRSPQNGGLQIPAFFDAKREYQVTVEENGQIVIVLYLYALKPDLFARNPYKGDLHMHTYYSDGKECPSYLASRYREIGYDFFAITDHGIYFPSMMAQEVFADVPVDAEIYPGEEVHPPQRAGIDDPVVPVHMLNIGGKFSVNAHFKDPDYPETIQRLAEKSDPSDGVDAFDYASVLRSLKKIKEAGG